MDKTTVDAVRVDAERAYIIYANLKKQFEEAQLTYIRLSRKFQDYDHCLALTDGRLKKIPPSTQRKPKKQPELTLEQLKSIAATLGVNITIEDEEPEPEEELEVGEDEAKV